MYFSVYLLLVVLLIFSPFVEILLVAVISYPVTMSHHHFKLKLVMKYRIRTSEARRTCCKLT